MVGGEGRSGEGWLGGWSGVVSGVGWIRTLGLALGLSCSSFFAAASMDAAAPSSSVSAITVGSSGSTHSVPGTTTTHSAINLRELPSHLEAEFILSCPACTADEGELQHWRSTVWEGQHSDHRDNACINMQV